jgi:hypothetical protein
MTFGLVFRRSVLFLASDKRPYFVALYALARQVSQRLVLIIRTRFASINQQFDDAVNCRVRQSGSGADAVTINQTTQDLNPLSSAQFIHVPIMLARASNVNNKNQLV